LTYHLKKIAVIRLPLNPTRKSAGALAVDDFRRKPKFLDRHERPSHS
jgi:hypothetical protein